jgi:CheY-like chemotaxis protein
MKKLIFIDDSPLDHFILKRILNKYKLAYDINCSTNGKEVLDFLDQNKFDKTILPDIILLDLYMPDFDGWAFLEKMRYIYPDVIKPFKIYIFSSTINPDDIARATLYPFVKSFIFKPITRETLEKLINAVVPDSI